MKLKTEREDTEKLISKKFNKKMAPEQIRIPRKKYFVQFDAYLDKANSNESHLMNPAIARLVSEAIHFRDQKEYDLMAYCIMPNHVHMMFVGRNDISPYKILQSLKRHTAREANKVLKRTGAFWQHESYDQMVRDDKEFENILSYILNNPIKAGLVKNWKDWEWSYYRSK